MNIRPMLRGLQRCGTALALAACLAACSTPPPRPTTADHPSWSGRLSLQIDTQPVQHYSASFELSGGPNQGELSLFSPFGQTLAHARWTPDSAHLTQSGRQQDFLNLDDLSQHLTGTALPVAALFDWLRGLPTAQNGWYLDNAKPPSPGRFTARRDAPEPTAQLRIVLD